MHTKGTYGWRRRLAVSVVFLGALLLCLSPVAAQEEVSNADELQAIANDLDGDYVLTDYIDLSGFTFEQVGDSENPFTGTFDGNGHTVSGLSIDVSDDEVGLFGRVGEDGAVEDVGVVDADVNGNQDVGALVGRNAGEITDSYATGRVSGRENTGGLVGRNIGEVRASHTEARVSGRANAGGVVGRNVGTVRRSYSTGGVTGDDSVGGVVGYNLGEVIDTYATGGVSGRVTVGGLVGHNRGRATVRTSYATGEVEADAEASALIGLNEADVADSYYDVQTTGEDQRFRRDPPGTGLSSSEMEGGNAERDMEGFDFEGTWKTGSGYPTLVQESTEEGEEGDTNQGGTGDDGETTQDNDGDGTTDENEGGADDGEMGADDEEGPSEGDNKETTEDGGEDDDGSGEGMPGFGVFAGLLALCAAGMRHATTT